MRFLKWTMKSGRLLIGIGLAVLLVSCSSPLPTPTPVPKEASVPLDPTWQPPQFLDIEVFIASRDSSMNQGYTGTPNLRQLRADSWIKFRYAYGDVGTIPYEAEIQYLGRAAEGDKYRLHYSVPVAGNSSQEKEEAIVFKGGMLEVFKDDQYVIGIRAVGIKPTEMTPPKLESVAPESLPVSVPTPTPSAAPSLLP